MAESLFGITLGAISSIIISGGIAAAIFEFIRDLFLRRREEYVEISKIKIDTLNRAGPYYAELEIISYEISFLLKENPINNMMLFYKMCILIHSYYKFNKDIGGHYFDNIHADVILDALSASVPDLFREKINLEYFSRLSYLVKDDTSYDQFCRNPLSTNLYPQFETMFNNLTSKEKEEIEKSMRWFSDILAVESQYSYKLWYGEKPYLDIVSDDLLEELKSKYPVYYKRINSLGKTRFFRRERKIRAKEDP